MPLFFISYSRTDGLELARKLERDINLASSNNQVFLDKSSIGIGQDWAESIKENIENCDFFILIISPASHFSEWIKKEIAFAKASEFKTGLKKLFIIKYPGITHPEFVPQNIQFLELTKNWAVDFHRLMLGIKSNYSFYSIEQKLINKGNYYDVVLQLKSSDTKFIALVHSVEYRFDYGFSQAELGFKKVILKENKEDNFKITFWTDQPVTIFIVIYLTNNTKQIDIIHKVNIG